MSCSRTMRRCLSLLIASIFLSLPIASVYADEVSFKDMSLEELKTYDTAGLTKKEAKAHKKAHKKAQRKADREAKKAARKNSPKKGYCSRAQESRGTC